MKKYFLGALILAFIIPQLVLAAGLVPCSGANCTTCDLLKLVSNIASFVVKDVAIPLAGLLFLASGIMMVVSGGSEERFKKGRLMMINTLIGIVIVFASWVLVNALITSFAVNTNGVTVENWYTVKCSK